MLASDYRVGTSSRRCGDHRSDAGRGGSCTASRRRFSNQCHMCLCGPNQGLALDMAPTRVRDCAAPRSIDCRQLQAEASRRQSGPRKAVAKQLSTVRFRSKSCLVSCPDGTSSGRRFVVAPSREHLSMRMWGRRSGRPGGCLFRIELVANGSAQWSCRRGGHHGIYPNAACTYPLRGST